MTALAPTIVDNSVTLTWGPNHQYYGYCTVADVSYEFPHSANYINLTNSVIGQEITNASEQMHELLVHAYVMPYAGADGGILLTLRDINAKLAVALLIERYFQAAEPDVSPAGDLRRVAAMQRINEVLNGSIRWDLPFGDAVSNAMKPVYDVSAAATITPSPNALDGSGTPIFTISTRSRFRNGVVM